MPYNTEGVSSSGGGGSSTTSGLVTYNATRPVLSDGASEPIQGDSLGNQYVNPGIYNTSSFTQAVVAVATTAGGTPLLSANTSRTYLLIQNQDATNPIWVAFGGTPTATAAFLKIPAGGTFILENSVISTQAISAISTGASVNVQVIQAS